MSTELRSTQVPAAYAAAETADLTAPLGKLLVSTMSGPHNNTEQTIT